MLTITRSLLSVKEIKLYSACCRFNDPQSDIARGFVHPDYSIKLSLMHTVTKDKFKINPSNHFNVTRALEEAVLWYYDKEKKDMFYLEDGILQFNYDYGRLYVNSSSPDGEHIEIRPVVDYSVSDRGREGAVIYINNTDTQTIISRPDLEAFYTILKTFSFQTEAMLLLYELDRASKDYIENGGTIDESTGQFHYL